MALPTARGLLVATVVVLAAACGDDSETNAPLTSENYAVEPRWTDLYDSGESNVNQGDDPAHVVASDGVVVVSGQAGPTYDLLAYLVRALDGSTGELLWEDRVEWPGCQNAAGSMVVRQHQLLVNGTSCAHPLVRSYDLISGALLWERASADHEVFNPGQLLACGDVAVSVVETSDGFTWVQARTLESGTMLWSLESPSVGGTRSACDERTLVLALTVDAPGEPSYQQFIRAYDVASGALRWETEEVQSMSLSRVYTMAIGARTLVSFVETRDPEAYWLAAHAIETGQRIWVAPFRKSSSISDIVVGPDRIHIVGVAGRYDPQSDYWRNEFYVASRATTTGKRLWQDRRHVLADEQAEWVILDGRRLFVGGWENQLRVYDALTGEVAWESTDHLSGPGQDIATDGHRLYALAEVRPNEVPEDDEDFFLRAYAEVPQ